jgi:hypothetical protein
MSFRVHAAGTRGFRWSRDNNPDDDIFQAASVIAALNATRPSAGGVIEGVGEYANPAPNIVDAAAAVASLTFTARLRQSVDELCAINARRPGWIAVTPRSTSILWADSVSHVRYDLGNEDSDGAGFIRSILPALSATGFNHYGSFRVLMQAVDRYKDSLGSSEIAMLLVEMTR